MDPPNTSMWRDEPRLFGEFPSDNLSSVLSCDQRAQQAAATTKQRSHTYYWLRVFPTEETYLRALVIANLLLLPPDPV